MTTKKLYLLGVGGLLSLSLYTSCTHDTENIEALPEVCFEAEILPLFQTNCAISGCHNNETKESGKVFDSYANIMKSGVEPYEPNKSEAYRLMHAQYGGIMPPSGPIPQESRTLIRVWIEQGAKETTCAEPTISFATDVQPILTLNCVKSNCHNTTSKAAGKDFSTYASVIASNVLVTGNKLDSRIYQVISDIEGYYMPKSPNTRLTDGQIDTIGIWIQEGTLNN